MAIGETGLDFYRNLSPPAAQMESFVAHHGLALDMGKPLVVHCRDAFRQIYEVLERDGAGPWVVLHCWTGGPRWSRRFSELGVTFSFAGPVTFETGDTVRRGAAVVPPRPDGRWRPTRLTWRLFPIGESRTSRLTSRWSGRPWETCGVWIRAEVALLTG